MKPSERDRPTLPLYKRLKNLCKIITFLCKDYKSTAFDCSNEYVNTYFDFSAVARQKRKLLDAKEKLYESAYCLAKNLGGRIEIARSDDERLKLEEQMIYTLFLVIEQFAQLEKDHTHPLPQIHKQVANHTENSNSEEPFSCIFTYRNAKKNKIPYKKVSLESKPYSSIDYLFKAWSTVISGVITIGMGGGCTCIAFSPSIEKDPVMRNSDLNGSILLIIMGFLTISLGLYVLYQKEYKNIQADISIFEKFAQNYSKLETELSPANTNTPN